MVGFNWLSSLGIGGIFLALVSALVRDLRYPNMALNYIIKY